MCCLPRFLGGLCDFYRIHEFTDSLMHYFLSDSILNTAGQMPVMESVG